MYIIFTCLIVCVFLNINAQELDLKCPSSWVNDKDSCYKFVRSPKKNQHEGRKHCQNYNADLVSVTTKEEHIFLLRYLLQNDPLHRDWYTSGTQKTTGIWENGGDNTKLNDMPEIFLPSHISVPDRKYLVYRFSDEIKSWGLTSVVGDEALQFICEIPTSDLGTLIDEDTERDHEYGLFVVDPEKVPHAPIVVKQPKDALFDLVQRSVVNYVSLQFLADGYPYPSYEWYKETYENEVAVSKLVNPLEDERITVSGGTLIINNPEQIIDRGKYHCVARNELGAIQSETVQISFAYVGDFNVDRANEQGNQFWGKAIYCDPPQHFPDVQYYWARNFFPNFVEEDKRTMVSHDGNLYFSYLDNIDRGKYSCNVQSTVSDMGKSGPFFGLDIYAHPNYQQLKFANNFPKAFPEAPLRGDDVRLECIAFGYPVPSYNWTRRNGILPRDAKLMNYNRVLLLPKVEPRDIGEYICRAENAKLAIENSIFLSIQAKPSFTIPLHDQFIAEGEDLIWECEAFGIPDVEYEWLKNAKLLVLEDLEEAERERYELADNILKISHVKAGYDEGSYQCRAKNQLSSSYSTAELVILKLKPSFVKQPLEEETFAAEEMNVTLVCNPEAAPRPEFVWRKNGIKLNSDNRRTILSNGNLVITRVTREDRGNYTCVATNEYGTDSSSGYLKILDRPYFRNQIPKIIHESVGVNLTVRCDVLTDNILDTTYVWRHNGLRIKVEDYFLDPYYYYWENLHLQPIETERIKDLEFTRRREPPFRQGYMPGYLRIENLTLEDAGVYECVAKTPIGSIFIDTTLIVRGPPGPPGGLTTVDLKSTEARLLWVDGFDNGYEIVNYTIQGRTQWNNEWKTLAENVTAEIVDYLTDRKQYQVPSLSPWSTYEFRVAAINRLGRGEFSASSPKANTGKAVPFVSPTNITGGGGKTGDLTVQWAPLTGEEQNAPGVYYKVFWKRNEFTPELQYQQMVLKHRGNVGLHVVSIDPTYYFTKYLVKVQAWNEMGPGPISAPFEVYSAEKKPSEQPTDVRVVAFNATCLNVTWRPVVPTRENIHGKLIGYRIRYWRSSDNETDSLIRLHLGEQARAQIVGLIPDTEYWVRVMAYNSAGSGPESEAILDRTWRYPPLTPPNAVMVKPINPSTVYVTWRGVTPSTIEEPLIGYMVKVWESSLDITQANDTIVLVGNPLRAYIYDLVFGKIYKLRVLAFSRGGLGKMSSPAWEFQMGDPQALLNSVPALITWHPVFFGIILGLVQLCGN